MLKWLRKMLSTIIIRLRGSAQTQTKIQIIEKIEDLQSTEYKPNRRQRRTLSAYEKARKRHDKFVEPKGERPALRSRAAVTVSKKKKEKVLQNEELEIKSAETLIVDKHHETGIDVLYKESEIYGEFNFRDTILSQLGSYFSYLRRMRYNDPDAYHLYRQIGGIVAPYTAVGLEHFSREPRDHDKTKMIVSDWFVGNRPAFGCIAYGANLQGEKVEKKKSGKKSTMWLPKFLYFTKYDKPPPELQPTSGGDVYAMTVWWDQPYNNRFTRKAGKRGGVPQEFGIFVSHDGKVVRALKQIDTKFIGDIPSRRWRIPHEMEEWAKDHKADVQTFLANVFLGAMEQYEQSGMSMIRVEASKDDMCAVFGVSVQRTAYFFKDRDYVLNEHGRRKPVFHIVKAHERVLGDKKTSVRLHFRGDREFDWAGYKVLITVPGKDHFMMSEFDIGSTDEYWKEKGQKLEDSKKLGAHLHSWIRKGVGGQ